jgi:hypothetical protein
VPNAEGVLAVAANDMAIDLTRIEVADKPVLEHLFQNYLYDMSEFSGWPIAANRTVCEATKDYNGTDMTFFSFQAGNIAM